MKCGRNSIISRTTSHADYIATQKFGLERARFMCAIGDRLKEAWWMEDGAA